MTTNYGRTVARNEVFAGGRRERLRWIDAMARIEPRPLALAIGACIVVLGVLGVAELHWSSALAKFNLDREYNVPATFSAALDISAAIGAEALRRRTGKNVLFGLVVLFAFMGLDEFSSLHEHLERWSGVDWEKLYTPIFIYAAVSWIAVLRTFRQRDFWLLMFGGAGAWFVAQVFEYFEWNGNVKQPHYNLMMVPEELLEMTGSALFLLAMLTALRSWERRRQEPETGLEPATHALQERCSTN